MVITVDVNICTCGQEDNSLFRNMTACWMYFPKPTRVGMCREPNS